MLATFKALASKIVKLKIEPEVDKSSKLCKAFFEELASFTVIRIQIVDNYPIFRVIEC